MKTKLILTFSILFVLIYSCQEDDVTFGDVVAPTNLQVQVEVASDQSGNVTIIPTAENAINFHVFFIESQDPIIVTESGGQANFRYTQPGQFTQVITIVAFGTGGASSSATVTIDLDVNLSIDPLILEALVGASSGSSSKQWIWDSTNAGHFGVGDPAENFPNFFSAAPNQLNGCLYDDSLTFSHDGQGNFIYNVATSGTTFINWAEVTRFFPDASPNQFEDECRNINDQIATDADTDFVIITDETTGVSTLRVTNSTLSYWSGAMEYEIVELTVGRLTVRGIQEPFDPPGAPLAWYHTFVPANGGDEGDGGEFNCDDGGSTGDMGNGNNDVLVWADEFDVDGPPCDANWQYDIGTGENGWGNGELQYYTDRPENIIVEDGLLKIRAVRENLNGSEYTSARINSKDLYEFEYGRVEIRAKLPTGGGTWPALWLLGADIDTNPWPGAGEIDMMEHIGNQQDRIFSTLHFEGMSGADGPGDSFIVDGVSEEFHVYEMIWTPAQIRLIVDGNINFIFFISGEIPTVTYNKEFFFLMNVAMGGSFGGNIDPNFQESTMEVDYIRVYQ